MLKEELEVAMASLTERERNVIKLRFGLDDGKTRTLEEVGKEFNVTRERIRQIEAKALRNYGIQAGAGNLRISWSNVLRARRISSSACCQMINN